MAVSWSLLRQTVFTNLDCEKPLSQSAESAGKVRMRSVRCRMSGHWSVYGSLMVDHVCFLKDPGLEHMHCKVIVLPSYSLKADFLHQCNLEYT